jgi:hypothetical protein
MLEPVRAHSISQAADTYSKIWLINRACFYYARGQRELAPGVLRDLPDHERFTARVRHICALCNCRANGMQSSRHMGVEEIAHRLPRTAATRASTEHAMHRLHICGLRTVLQWYFDCVWCWLRSVAKSPIQARSISERTDSYRGCLRSV